MKAQSIIKQLQAVLPLYTSLFHDAIAITSLTRSGSIVTARCAAPHGMTVNQYIQITGALTPVKIDSLTFANGTAFAVTDSNHDITEGWTQSVTVSGADQAFYNGTFPLMDAVNRRNFSYKIASVPVSPATGNPYLLQNFPYGYNGVQFVTIVDANTFTYQNTTPSLDFVMGNPMLNTNLRISGAVSIERAMEAYTAQAKDKLWAFVIMGPTVSNKDRFVLTDSQQKIVKGQGFRIELIQNFSVFIFNSAKDTVGGRRNYDLMMDITVPLFKSLLGMLPDQLYSEPAQYGVGFIKHDLYAYNDAFYIHQFEFQIPYNIIEEDGVDPDFNVAFRDLDFNFTNPLDVAIISADVNLDDEPLP